MKSCVAKRKSKKPPTKIEEWWDLLLDLMDNFDDLYHETVVIVNLPKEEIYNFLNNLATSRGFILCFESLRGKYIIWLEPLKPIQ